MNLLSPQPQWEPGKQEPGGGEEVATGPDHGGGPKEGQEATRGRASISDTLPGSSQEPKRLLSKIESRLIVVKL